MASPRSGSDDGRTTVWLLVSALSVGGAERTIVNLANNLDRERYRVVVWTIFDTNPLATSLDGVSHRSLGVQPADTDDPDTVSAAANPIEYVAAPVRFFRLVRREQPDIVHSFLFYDNLIARAAGVVSPATSVIDGVRGYHNDSRPVAHALDRLSLWLSDASVANSPAGATYLRGQGVESDTVAVVPNSRDLDTYADGSADGLRESLGVPPRVPVVGTVGRLVERKGHFDLLEAWPDVVDEHPDAHLVIVGHGPERAALRQRSREHGVASRVHFTGSRDDVPDLLDMFDVFAFPSHWEGMPGALLEAMAAGLPIVATAIDGSDDLVTDGHTGVLVSPHDPDELATGLVELLSLDDRSKALGEAAQAEAYDRFTLAEMVARFENIYAALSDVEARTPPSEVPA